jgi:uncharacterized SAM-binding protein YcdF (DUF218 family)
VNDTLGDSSTLNAFGASRLVQSEPPRAVWGLLDRKERWGLSLRGRLILTSTLLLAAAFLFENVYPFLTTTHRVDAEVLVVEGWVHEYAIGAAVEEFRRGSYQRVLTTGGPVQGSGHYINDYQTAASVGADLLRKNGVPNESLQMVPSRVMDHDRTYGSAIALQNWFREQNMAVSGINVVTEDLHARRTRLLFQRALGDKVTVGVIAIPNPDYDAKHWWSYSEGVKQVVSEATAYIYARFLFRPSEAPSVQKAAASDSDTR